MPLAIALLAALTWPPSAGASSRHDVRRVHCAEGAGDDLVLEPFTAPRLGELNKAFAAFHKQYPWITVKSTGNTNPTKLTAAIRGGNAPDAVACSRPTPWGVLRVRCVDRPEPRIKSDRVNLNLFPKTIRDYTARGSAVRSPASRTRTASTTTRRCSRRRDSSQRPGHSRNSVYAKKLTQRDADGTISKVLGFNPLMNWYENSPSHWGPLVGATWMKNVEPRRRSRLGDAFAVAEEPRRLVRIQEPRQVAGKRRTSGPPRTRSSPARWR